MGMVVEEDEVVIKVDTEVGDMPEAVDIMGMIDGTKEISGTIVTVRGIEITVSTSVIIANNGDT